MKAHLSNTQTVPLLSWSELSDAARTELYFDRNGSLYFEYCGRPYATADMLNTDPVVLTSDHLLKEVGQHLYEPECDRNSHGVCAEYSPCGDAVKVSRFTMVRPRVAIYCIKYTGCGSVCKTADKAEFIQWIEQAEHEGNGFVIYGLSNRLEHIGMEVEDLK